MSLLGDALAGATIVRHEIQEQRSYTVELDQPPAGWTGGGWTTGMGTWSGPTTTSAEQAMTLSAVYACIRLISEAIATLPLNLFEDSETGLRNKITRAAKPGYLLFPEPGLSKIDYLSQLLLSLLTDGNGYVATPRDDLGRILQLIVLDPDMVTPAYRRFVRVDGTQGWRKVYELRTSSGVQDLDPIYDVMHIKGMCLPGRLCGISPIAYAAATAGVGLNAQRYGSSFFNNGALASAVIEAPQDFPDAAVNKWRDSWNAGHQGVGNANKIGVLVGGAKLNKVSITPDEAQFLQTRQFTVPDIARFYGVPPHLIADASNSTSWGSGLAEQNSAFGQLSLRPWTERIEEGHDRLLMLDGLRDAYSELDMDAVLRASYAERMTANAEAVAAEIITINEVRAGENLGPVPWGDLPASLRAGPPRPDPVDPAAADPQPLPAGA